MKYALPEGRPFTNFFWRYLPKMSDKSLQLVIYAGYMIVFPGGILLLLEIFKGDQFLYSSFRFPRLRGEGDFLTQLGVWLIIAGNFSKRRNFMEPLLADGMGFVEAELAWDHRPADQRRSVRLFGIGGDA